MFRITSFGELSGWRPIEMDMDRSPQPRCPCDDSTLSTLCCLIGGKVSELFYGGTLKVGACPSCGYIGYIDRPARKWFRDFYASEWDGTARNNQDDVRQLLRAEVKKPQPALGLVQACKPEPQERILEFGSGYCAVLYQLSQLGFSNVSGVEPCRHRAEIAKSELGVNVHCGELADLHGKYDLIYSAHVLEHCYDPDETIGQCARLQGLGGRLAINVPDAMYEPTMGQILFLPHLHSFTVMSLLNLLARHGYETFTTARDARNLIVIGVKTGRGLMERYAEDATESVTRKFVSALCPWDMSQCRQLWWNSDNDEVSSNQNPNWKRPRCVNIEPCEPITGHPVEIQFNGPVMLCVK